MSATLSSLPSELLIEVFRLLAPSAALAVCREFRRLYHDNARSVTLVRSGRVTRSTSALTAAVQHCPTLRRLTVPPGINAWPTGALTRLQRLEVAAGWPLDQIPPTLAHLAVNSNTGAQAAMAADRDLEWSGQVVAQLDAAASACVVELSAVSCWRDLVWLSSPRVRLGSVDARGVNNALLMRVLQAAPVLQLASLSANHADRHALDVLQSTNLPQLTALRLGLCLEFNGLPALMARQAQLCSFTLADCNSVTTLQGLGRSLTHLSLHMCYTAACNGFAAAAPPHLACLQLRGGGVTSLQGLSGAGLSALTELDIESQDIVNLQGLEHAGLSALRILKLNLCCNLLSLEGLSHVPSLQTLSMQGCSGLTSLRVSALFATPHPAPQLARLHLDLRHGLSISRSQTSGVVVTGSGVRWVA